MVSKKILLLLLLSAAISLILLLSAIALAVPEWSETPVVSNTFDQVNASISGSKVVWQDYRNKATGCPTAQNCLPADVYSKDLSTGVETRLTTSTNALDPDVSGNIVVWRDWDTGKIKQYNLGTGVTSVVSTATGTIQEVTPAISGNIVVWSDFRNSTDYGDIYMRDLSAAGDVPVYRPTDIPNYYTLITADPATDTFTSAAHGINNKTAVQFHTSGGTLPGGVNGTATYYVVAATADTFQVSTVKDGTAVDLTSAGAGTNHVIRYSTPQKDKRNPDVSGNIVVWEDWRNAYQDDQGWWHNPDIYAIDISTGVQYAVCTNSSDQYSPVVSDGRVFWQDHRNGNWDIYMKDLATGVETRVTNNAADQSWPTASGDFVVWKDTRNGDEDVYMKRLSTGVEQMINTDGSLPTAAQKLPVISGGRVVWMDKRAGNWDIYTATDTVAPQLSAMSPTGAVAGTDVTISALITESGTAVDTSSISVTLDGGALAGCSVSENSVSCQATGLSEGPHDYQISVSDTAGNTAVENGSFEVDTIAPEIVNLSPSGWTGSTGPTIGADYSDAGSGVDPATAQVYVDGVMLAGCSKGADSVSCGASGLADGEHAVSVTVMDFTGNQGLAEGSFSVDTTAPQVTPGGPQGTLSSASAVITASYADVAGSGIDTGTVSVKLDEVPLACTAGAESVECNAGDLANGTHTVLVSASDNVGNPGEAAWSFEVNVTAPLLSNLQPAAGAFVNQPKPLVSIDYAANGRPVDSASIRMYLDGVDVTASSQLGDGYVRYQTETPLANGTHSARFIVADVQGTTADQTWTFNVTSPSMSLNLMDTYWASYDEYLDRRLSVDYQLSVPGDGAARSTQLAVAYATNGVIAETQLPIAFGDILAHSQVDYTLKYVVPAGVAKFRAFSHVSCTDDAGNLYWFAGPPPDGGPSA